MNDQALLQTNEPGREKHSLTTIDWLLAQMEKREDRLLRYSPRGMVNLETVREILTEFLNDGWILVTEKKPEVEFYSRIFLTIRYPNGYLRALEGRYDSVREVFLYPNQKEIKYEVLAWRKFSLPKPYVPTEGIGKEQKYER